MLDLPGVTVNECPASMELLIIWQQKLHVCLEKEADLFLCSSLALFLFLLMLFLFAEDRIQVLSNREPHHEVCGGKK